MLLLKNIRFYRVVTLDYPQNKCYLYSRAARFKKTVWGIVFEIFVIAPSKELL
jgi:hypothetical protein